MNMRVIACVAVAAVWAAVNAPAQTRPEATTQPTTPTLKVVTLEPKFLPPGETGLRETWLPSYDMKHAMWLTREGLQLHLVVDGTASPAFDHIIATPVANEDASEVRISVRIDAKPYFLLYQSGKYTLVSGNESVITTHRLFAPDDPRWPRMNLHPLNILTTPEDTINFQGKSYGPYTDSHVIFHLTGDGQHVFYKVMPKHDATGSDYFIDGRKVYSSKTTNDLHVSPDGKAWIMDLRPDGPMVFNGQEVQIKTQIDGAFQPVISPDGTRWAAAGRERGGRCHVWVDGVQNPIGFDRLQSARVTFSADSKSVAYIASSGARSMIVYDGKPGPSVAGQIGNFILGPTPHMAYLADGKLYVDGKEISLASGEFRRMAFSPSGERFAWVALVRNKLNEQLVLRVDGAQVDLPFHSLTNGLYMAFDGENRIVLTGQRRATEAEIKASGSLPKDSLKLGSLDPWIKVVCDLTADK